MIGTFGEKMHIEKDEVEELRRAINIYDGAVKTGNEALDILIAEKSFFCQEKQACASVVDVFAAFDQAGGDQLVDQTDNGRWFDADRFGDDAWADTVAKTADGDDRPCNGLCQPETGSKSVANRLVGTRDLCHGNHQFHKRAIVSGHSMFTF